MTIAYNSKCGRSLDTSLKKGDKSHGRVPRRLQNAKDKANKKGELTISPGQLLWILREITVIRSNVLTDPDDALKQLCNTQWVNTNEGVANLLEAWKIFAEQSSYTPGKLYLKLRKPHDEENSQAWKHCPAKRYLTISSSGMPPNNT